MVFSAKTQIKVSVCIPAFKRLDLLQRCLGSVLDQDFADFEVIITDDSPGREIAEWLRGISDRRIVYQHNQPPLGAPENWNCAIRLASGEYIKVLHHDDYFENNKALTMFVQALENNPQADLAFSQMNIRFLKQQVFYRHKHTATQLKRLRDNADFLFFRNIIGNPSAVIFRNNRHLFFDPRYRWLVDVELYIKILKKNPYFVVIPKPLVVSVDGEEGQITGSVSDNAQVVISESLRLFAGIRNDKILNSYKSSLYFQELFLRFGISSKSQLESLVKLPAVLDTFIDEAFAGMNHNRLWKRLLKRILTSRYNKRFFKIERF